MAKTDYIFENPHDSPEFLLWQVTTLWQKEKSIVLEKYNLTNSQMTLLVSILWLIQQKIEVTQIVLSSQANIDPMTTSTVLRTLQSKGLVIREEHNGYKGKNSTSQRRRQKINNTSLKEC